LVGNGGHMAYVDYSSFDPIFFLHHVNVDRLFAMWQAINPNIWVASQTNGGGTYAIAPGTVENSNTPLFPFRRPDGSWFTSNSARDTSSFGYGYVETPKWRYKNNPSGYAAFVRQQVNNLYGSTSQTLSAAARRRKRDVNDPNNSTEVALDRSVNDRQYTDWRVNIVADKAALPGSVFIHVFVGTPGPDPALWSAQKELAGDYMIFSSLGAVAPGMDTLVTGALPLTEALIGAFESEGLKSLEPAVVLPFLKKNFAWTVTLMNDSSIPIETIRGLKIVIESAIVTIPEDDQDGTIFPEYSEYTPVLPIVDTI